MKLIACPALNQPSKIQKFLTILVLIGFLVNLTGKSQVLAQTETQGLTQNLPSNLTGEFGLNGLKTDYVWTKASLATEIANQRKIYRDQLVIYRQQEKNFFIAQDQYLRHETLDAIEQAVKATRQVLLSRDQVLHTYLTLLQLRLMEAEGVEISLKTELLTKLEVVREKLKVHHASAIDQLDRPTANKLSDQFTVIGEESELLGSQVLGLLSLGKLQEIFDKSMALSPDITAEVTVTTVDKAVSAETTRSLRETAASLVLAKKSLDLTWEKVTDRVLSEADISGQSDFSQELNVSYANLTKSLGYFLELLKLYRTVGAAST